MSASQILLQEAASLFGLLLSRMIMTFEEVFGDFQCVLLQIWGSFDYYKGLPLYPECPQEGYNLLYRC